MLRSQCPDINSNKISNTIHKNYVGFTSILKGFQKCIVRNPSNGRAVIASIANSG